MRSSLLILDLKDGKGLRKARGRQDAVSNIGQNLMLANIDYPA